MKSGFKRTINWNKRQPKEPKQRQNPYLDYSIDPSFQGVNRLFVLSIKENAHQTSYKRNAFRMVEIKDDNAMIDGKNFSDWAVKKMI